LNICSSEPPRSSTVWPAIIAKFRRFAAMKTTKTAIAKPPWSVAPVSSSTCSTSAPSSGNVA
jgi:hypothetical protein